jgi:hypothetical protein
MKDVISRNTKFAKCIEGLINAGLACSCMAKRTHLSKIGYREVSLASKTLSEN